MIASVIFFGGIGLTAVLSFYIASITPPLAVKVFVLGAIVTTVAAIATYAGMKVASEVKGIWQLFTVKGDEL